MGKLRFSIPFFSYWALNAQQVFKCITSKDGIRMQLTDSNYDILILAFWCHLPSFHTTIWIKHIWTLRPNNQLKTQSLDRSSNSSNDLFCVCSLRWGWSRSICSEWTLLLLFTGVQSVWYVCVCDGSVVVVHTLKQKWNSVFPWPSCYYL